MKNVGGTNAYHSLTLSQCQQLCHMTTQCLYFSWKKGGYCYLLRNNVGMIKDDEKYNNTFLGHRNSEGIDIEIKYLIF